MTVGVVIPCRNEARWLAEVLAALLAQDHRPDEVVVVDDGSVDRTIGVVDDWRARNEGLAVRVIAGPRRGIAAAVNAGIAVIGTDVVVRLDGHCCPDREYIGRAVAHLSEPGVGVAGGVWIIEPGAPSRRAEAIAVANEDYDFNYRVRQLGLRVVLDPRIRCTYYARPTITAVARQYARYGWWKARMLVHHPESIRWRQVIPALLFPSLLVLGLGVFLEAGPAWAALLAIYPAALLVGSAHAAATRHKWATAGWIAAAFLAIHLAWSVAFWLSLTSPAETEGTGVSGRRVIALLVAILLATAVLPPALAWTVNQRRIDSARAAAAEIARRLVRRGSEEPGTATVEVLCGPGRLPFAKTGASDPWLAAARGDLAAVIGDSVKVAKDPWGNAYLINLRASSADSRGVVFSAGPNGTIETPFARPVPGGDDIVAEIR